MKLKIGIYTIHAHYNYGAMFQAYATQVALQKLGYDAEIVNYYTKEIDAANNLKANLLQPKNLVKYLIARLNPKIKLKLKRFKSFHNQMNLSPYFSSIEEMKRYVPVYDLHLVGSDQVWNLENGISKESAFFLDFLPEYSKKISYASSFGKDNIPETYKIKLFDLLSSFSELLVREESGVDILKSCNLKGKQVLDPTFLPGTEFWSELAGEKRLIKEKYIFAYGFGDVEESNKILNGIKGKLKLPVIGTSVSIISPHNYDVFYNEAGPIEFLNLVKNAEFVITASYHGAAFAIHFKKSFLVKGHLTRNTRMESMLNLFGLMDRLITTENDVIEIYEKGSLFFDYSKINNRIIEETNRSILLLNNAIKNLN